MKKYNFILHPYKGCLVHGKLEIIDGKGFLKYYWRESLSELPKLVEEDGVYESLNPRLVKCILYQATSICEINYATLWSY